MRLLGAIDPLFEEILTPDALSFLGTIVRQFSGSLETLLERRYRIAQQIRSGTFPDFLPETRNIRDSSWRVSSIPSDLRQRRVEITGPVDRKMIINALNSGADVYMADFEDSHSPTWKATVQGQVNLLDAVDGTIEYVGPEGKTYRLNARRATLCVRPRGLHLSEKHVLIDGNPVPASFFDFSLYLYHNAKKLLQKGTGPYFYLPKLENHLEARLWNRIFQKAEDILSLRNGTIKCSVLVENILAAFEMDEVLYELREYVTALNFGRWDYIFSYIKKLGHSPRFVLPDRSLLTMNAPFLKSCSLLLVDTSHKRGAQAIGGMAAQVPMRNNPEATMEAIDKVVMDKKRELEQGYQGAWVAHPGLVPVVMEVFNGNQTENRAFGLRREDPEITARDLLEPPRGPVTEGGLRSNIGVSLRYLESWLRGQGCVAINNLMEDTATVEICRAQLWQWIRQQSLLSDGRKITPELFRDLLSEEMVRNASESGDLISQEKMELAGRILDQLVTEKDFAEFMTLVAYDNLD